LVSCRNIRRDMDINYSLAFIEEITFVVSGNSRYFFQCIMEVKLIRGYIVITSLEILCIFMK
jgi:hypothetical protein